LIETENQQARSPASGEAASQTAVQRQHSERPVTVDPTAAEDFLRAFFACTSCDVELRALPCKARLFTRDLGDVRRFVEGHSDQSLYFGVATRERGGDKAHCRDIPALWCDVDFKTTPEPRARESMKSLTMTPSIVVSSGGGWHLYWLLAEPTSASDVRIEPTLRGLARALGGDRAAAEIARIMRLPGTTNWKYDPPRRCQILEANWDRRYSLTEFERYAEQAPNEQANGVAAREPIPAGEAIPEGQRNSQLTRVAGKMRRTGLSESEMRAALRAVNQERCNPPLLETEVDAIAASVARYPAGTSVTLEPRGSLRAITASDLLRLEIKPHEMLLAPILTEQGLSMIHSRRGVGKTHLALGIAVAVASGKNLLRWQAPKPRKVVVIDGELPASVLQLWTAEQVAALGVDGDCDNLTFITPDLQEFGIPDLASIKGQEALLEHIEPADMVILDNLSALVRAGHENEAESWLPMQAWALELRRRGKSVLFVHHSGRSGNPRGTSKREDLLDVVMELRLPVDYRASEGLRAEVHFTKKRYLQGQDAEPFEVELRPDASGVLQWLTRDVHASGYEKAAELFAAGCDVRAVQEELGVSRATAFRYRKQWSESEAVAVSGPDPRCVTIDCRPIGDEHQH